MYHRFGDPASRYQATYGQFTQELDWLQAHGYTTVTLAQAYDALAGAGQLPDKPVLLTFDDNYASQWQAAQALDARGMHGVFFVITGQPGLTDDQIRYLAAEGHEIEAHTIHHPDLTTLSDDQLRAELTEPRAKLQALTGQPVDFLAYPYGAYDNRVIAAAHAAGYRGALAAWGGESWTPDTWWNEPRVEIDGGLTLEQFAAYLE
jgi:peptidoglycan/xylan/chitin deacetylase (PgdA/CDA1 family)